MGDTKKDTNKLEIQEATKIFYGERPGLASKEKEIDGLSDDFYVKQFKDNGRLHFTLLKKYDAKTEEINELEMFLNRWREIYFHVTSQLTEKEARVYNSLTNARIEKLKSFQKVDIVVEDIGKFQLSLNQKKKDYKFKVGLEYAKGTLQPYKDLVYAKKINWKDIPAKLALEPNSRQYITDTLMDNRKHSNRNFRDDPKCIIKVFDYCTKEKIEMVPEFINQYEIAKTLI